MRAPMAYIAMALIEKEAAVMVPTEETVRTE